MKKTTRIITTVASVLLPFSQAFAQPGNTGPAPINISFPNPLEGRGIDTIPELVQVILNDIVIPIGAVVVVFLIIYSGFLFVTARGNEAQLTKAKQNFLWVVVGAAILLGSWAIAQTIGATVRQITAP